MQNLRYKNNFFFDIIFLFPTFNMLTLYNFKSIMGISVHVFLIQQLNGNHTNKKINKLILTIFYVKKFLADRLLHFTYKNFFQNVS